MTWELIAWCESFKNLRLQGKIEEYRAQAARCVEILRQRELIPEEFELCEILSGGRVNYFTAKLRSKEREVFVKFASGQLEARVLRYGMSGQIATAGQRFNSARCLQIIEVDSSFLYIFDWLGTLEITRTEEDDEIRLRGLAEFNLLNRIATPEGRLAGIPRHSLAIRPRSLDALQARGAPDDLIARQKEVMAAWHRASQALQKCSLCPSIRDSGRGNVAIQGGSAVLVDFGASHYTPVGFDMWPYVFETPDIQTSAASVARSIYGPDLPTDISPDEIALAGAAAACLMVLDVFVGSRSYISERTIRKLQETAIDLAMAA